MSKRVIFIEHDHVSEGGPIWHQFKVRGYEITRFVIVDKEHQKTPNVTVTWPDLLSFDVVVVMGAPYAAYGDDVVGNWLLPELEKMKEVHNAGIPVLGICLGLQVIGIVFGAKVSGASELIHGRTSVIEHCGENIFKEIPNNFRATRYHSLALEENSIGGLIEITARSDDKTIMGIRIKDKDIYGVQFHPEAVLSEFGYELLANWLEICGDVGARKRINGMSPIASNS